ncbi:MAG TPA: membrane dipeptidase, partial [Polyangia bacterium]|nr:membrane dipeptidase [Polyangia bacterium]
MERRRFALALICWLAAWSCGTEPTAAGAPPARVAAVAPLPEPRPVEIPRERAARVHREAFVLDAHADTLMRVVDDGYDLGARNAEGHVDFPRLSEGGVDGQVFAVWVDPDTHKGRLWPRAVAMIDA